MPVRAQRALRHGGDRPALGYRGTDRAGFPDGDVIQPVQSGRHPVPARCLPAAHVVRRVDPRPERDAAAVETGAPAATAARHARGAARSGARLPLPAVRVHDRSARERLARAVAAPPAHQRVRPVQLGLADRAGRRLHALRAATALGRCAPAAAHPAFLHRHGAARAARPRRALAPPRPPRRRAVAHAAADRGRASRRRQYRREAT